MAFTFNNYQPSSMKEYPMNDMIGKILSGYSDTTKAKYLGKEKEADIFSKQISPLAMLASSPFFSSMQPQQQQQIAAFISKMMGQQGIQGGAGGMGAPQGSIGQPGEMDGNQQAGGQQAGYGGNPNSLVPQNPGEHFTGQYTQSPYTGGTAHRGAGGETIYAPTGSNVQKGLDVITETKGLKKLFDNYAKIAPKVGGGGGFKRDLSAVASGIEKTKLPFTDKISNFLGGSTLSNEAADAESYKNQMTPALRSLGFTTPEINQMLRFYPGETEANIKHRLEQTWPVIERKIKTHQKNLNQGIDVNKNVMGENDVPRNIDQKTAHNEKAPGGYKEAPEGAIGLYRKGKLYYIPQNQVEEALSEGFSYE